MSQQTTNYNFILIENSDQILQSLQNLNSNFTSLDTILNSMSSLSFQVVQSLPATGTEGIIYLLPNSGSTPNIYDEYIWISGAYEVIGSTAIDLSGYEQTSNKVTSISSASTDTQYPSAKLLYNMLKARGINELTSPVRIWDLDDGLYKLPQGCTIYHQGASSTSNSITIDSDAYMIITSYVNSNVTTYKYFFIFDGSGSTSRYLYSGYSNSTTGGFNRLGVQSILTSISSYVKDNLTYSTAGTTYALSAYQGYVLKGIIDALDNKMTKNYSTTTSNKGTTLSITNSLDANIQDFKIFGMSSQSTTPTPSSPVNVDVVTGDVTINVSDGVATQTNLVSLGALELCKIGSIQDYIYKSNGVWYKHKSIEKITLTGQESWNINNGVLYASGVSDYSRTAFIPFCTRYQGVQSVSSSSGMTTDLTIAFGTSSSANRLFVKDSNYTTAGDFTTELSTNNLPLYYVLGAETDIEITDTTLIGQLDALLSLQTYKGTTNVTTTTTNLNPELVIVYCADNKVSSTYISTIWKGSQNDYDAIATKDANTLYLIEEA